MKALVLMCVLSLVTLAGPGHTAQVGKVLITGHGILKAQLKDSGKTAEGEPMHDGSDFAIAETTDRVPAKLGLAFGFSFVAQGKPEGAEITLDVVLRHPAYRTPDGKPLTQSRWTQTVTLGKTHWAGEIFDRDYKLEPGPWVLELYHQDKLVASHTFQVVQP